MVVAGDILIDFNKCPRANEIHYIYPPRAKDAVPRKDTNVFADLGYIAQYKYNDSHILVKYRKNGAIELWNRHGERLRSYTLHDDIKDQLKDVFDKLGADDYTLLDGGLLDSKHKAVKDTIVLWDILVLNGRHLRNTTYGERYNFLHGRVSSLEMWYYKTYNFGFKVNDNIFIPQNYQREHWDTMWDTLNEINAPFTMSNGDLKPLIEGIMMKALDIPLQFGIRENNNSNWLARSRVTTARHIF